MQSILLYIAFVFIVFLSINLRESMPDSNMYTRVTHFGVYSSKKAIQYVKSSHTKINLYHPITTYQSYDITSTRDLLQVTEKILHNTILPTQTRSNISNKNVRGMLLGYNALFERGPYGKRRKVWKQTRHTIAHADLYKTLCALMAAYDPTFHFDAIQINLSDQNGKLHVDQRNIGMSYIIALGDFHGTNLYNSGHFQILNHIIDIKYRFVKFYGQIPHRAMPALSRGRYSLVFFSASKGRVGNTQQRAGPFICLPSCCMGMSTLPIEVGEYIIPSTAVPQYSNSIEW